MKIAVRMDDITPDMNWDNFYFFQDLFQEMGITPLLGIVPDSHDPGLQIDTPVKDFYQRMASYQEKGYVFAVHGYDHVYTTSKGGIFPLNHFSEFAGVSYEDQLKRLTEGKRILKENGIDTDLFMAPGHSYDRNTLKALCAAGYKSVTDGFGSRPYVRNGLVFYPISYRMRKTLEGKKEGYSTLVIHANTVTDESKREYREIFRKYKNQFISYSEYMEIQPIKRTVFGMIREYSLASFKYFLSYKAHNLVKLLRKGRI